MKVFLEISRIHFSSESKYKSKKKLMFSRLKDIEHVLVYILLADKLNVAASSALKGDKLFSPRNFLIKFTVWNQIFHSAEFLRWNVFN